MIVVFAPSSLNTLDFFDSHIFLAFTPDGEKFSHVKHGYRHINQTQSACLNKKLNKIKQ